MSASEPQTPGSTFKTRDGMPTALKRKLIKTPSFRSRSWSRWLITKHYLASTNCTVSVRSPLRRDHTEGL
ncbi:hypothetical protein WJX77_011863 [Trebouxia sp. C0004]